jgi:hypothetical protein
MNIPDKYAASSDKHCTHNNQRVFHQLWQHQFPKNIKTLVYHMLFTL